MSLDKNKLYTEFMRWFRNPIGVSTIRHAQTRLAQVYHRYALDAEDVSGESPTNLDQWKFERPLLLETCRTAQQFAQRVDDAFVAYWTGTIFPIAVVPPASPPCPNVGGTGEFSVENTSGVTDVAVREMYSAIVDVLKRKDATAEEGARRLADAMDRVTKHAVTVTITGQDTTPSPTGPLYITNTCTVF